MGKSTLSIDFRSTQFWSQAEACVERRGNNRRKTTNGIDFALRAHTTYNVGESRNAIIIHFARREWEKFSELHSRQRDSQQHHDDPWSIHPTILDDQIRETREAVDNSIDHFNWVDEAFSLPKWAARRDFLTSYRRWSRVCKLSSCSFMSWGILIINCNFFRSFLHSKPRLSVLTENRSRWIELANFIIEWFWAFRVCTHTRQKKINIKRFLIVEWIEWTFSIIFFFLHQRFCRIKSKQHTRQIAGSLPVWQGLRLRWISFKPEKQTAENENILREEKSEIHSEHEKKECLEHAQWI